MRRKSEAWMTWILTQPVSPAGVKHQSFCPSHKQLRRSFICHNRRLQTSINPNLNLCLSGSYCSLSCLCVCTGTWEENISREEKKINNKKDSASATAFWPQTHSQTGAESDWIRLQQIVRGFINETIYIIKVTNFTFNIQEFSRWKMIEVCALSLIWHALQCGWCTLYF